MSKRFSMKDRSNRSAKEAEGPKHGKQLDDQVNMLEVMHQFTDRFVTTATAWLKVHGTMHSSVGSALTRPDALADAVNRLGQRVPQPAYSRVLLSTCEIEKRVSQAQRKFQREIEDHVLMPLKHWLKQDYHDMKKAVDSLDSRRRDLFRASRDLKQAGVTQAPDNPLDGPPEELAQLKKLTVPQVAFAKHQKFVRCADAYEEQKTLVTITKHLVRLSEFRSHHDACVKQLMRSWRDMSADIAKTTDQYALEA